MAEQYLGALFVSHSLVLIYLPQIVPGALLLANRFVPLAFTLLGPMLANIVFFHAFMAPEGLPLPLILGVLCPRSNRAGTWVVRRPGADKT